MSAANSRGSELPTANHSDSGLSAADINPAIVPSADDSDYHVPTADADWPPLSAENAPSDMSARDIAAKMSTTHGSTRMPPKDPCRMSTEDDAASLSTEDNYWMSAKNNVRMSAAHDARLSAPDHSRLPTENDCGLPAADRRRMPATDRRRMPATDDFLSGTAHVRLVRPNPRRPGTDQSIRRGHLGEYGSYYPEAYDEGAGWDAGYGVYDAYADQWGYYEEPYGGEYGHEEAYSPGNHASEMTDEHGNMYAFEYDESWFADQDE